MATPDTARDSAAGPVGFIGLGVMGRPMALNLLRAGYPLVVHSRSPGPVDELVALGALRAGTPAIVADNARTIITMLPDTGDVETVVYGPTGLLTTIRARSLVIDMSTIDPLAARRIGRDLAAANVRFLDAPVSGGQAGAIEGTLSIMVGGDALDLNAAMPFFDVLGKTVVHVGDLGAGQVAKAANQLIVGLGIEAVAEALSLATAAGVDPARVREALLGGFAASRVLEVHGRRMIERDFKAGFRVRLHLKDARIVTTTAGELGVPVPAFAIVADRLAELVDAGRGDLDHSALFLTDDGPTSSQHGVQGQSL